MKLEKIFSDGMVLQANKNVRIFGTGKGKVEVEFLGERFSTVSENDSWLLELKSYPYGGPYKMEINLDGEKTVIEDIYIGEVILCAGQSNMQFTMDAEVTKPEDYESDEYFRIFSLVRPEEGGLTSDDGWIVCEKEKVGTFSAIAYQIGLELRKKGVPYVGTIVCAQGASVIQSWTDKKLFDNNEELYVPADELFCDHRIKEYVNWNEFGTLHDLLFMKVAPYSIREIVWYQGESNASPAEGKIYVKLLKTMIENWREELKDSTLKFIVIQIAETRYDEGWLLIQKAQLEAPKYIENIETVICSDVCEKEMIHPVTKGLLSKRISASVLNEIRG